MAREPEKEFLTTVNSMHMGTLRATNKAAPGLAVRHGAGAREGVLEVGRLPASRAPRAAATLLPRLGLRVVPCAAATCLLDVRSNSCSMAGMVARAFVGVVERLKGS